MKPKIPFDEQVKEQLEHFTPEVPAHIWENIQQKKKRRRLGFWFTLNGMILLFCLIAAFVGGFIWWHSASEGYASSINIAGNSDINKEFKNKESVNLQEKGAVDPASQTTSSQSKKPNQVENVAGVKKSELTTSVVRTSNEPGSNQQRTGFEPGSNQQRTRLEPATNRVRTSNEPISKQQRKQRKISATSGEINHSNSENQYTTDIHDSMPEISEESKVTTAQILNEYWLSQSIDTVMIVSNKLPVPDSVLLVKNSDSAELKKLVIQTKTSKKEDIPCPGGYNDAANRTYFDIYGSADYGIRQFSDTAHSTYLQNRKETTRFTSAFSSGIRISRVFSNGIQIRTGINFTQINETFKFTQGNIIQVVYVVNGSGDTIGSYQTQSTRYKTTHNKYRTLDIPLTVGYEYGKGKWFMNVSGGVMINIRSWNKGEVLDHSLQPVNIGESSTPSVYQFKTNIGWAGLIHGSVSYKAGNKIRIFGEPYFRFNFSTMSKDEITFKQKYHLLGLRMGVRVDINKKGNK